MVIAQLDIKLHFVCPQPAFGGEFSSESVHEVKDIFGSMWVI
jgi:hypothetical protein